MEIRVILGFAGRGGWGSGIPKPEDFGGEIFNTRFGSVVLFSLCLPRPPVRAQILLP